MLKSVRVLLSIPMLLFVGVTIGFCADSPQNGFAVLYPILQTLEMDPDLEKEYCAAMGINYPIEGPKPIMPFQEYEKQNFSVPHRDETESRRRQVQWYKKYEYVVDFLRKALECPEFYVLPQPRASSEPLNLEDIFFSNKGLQRSPFGDLLMLRDFLNARALFFEHEKIPEGVFDTLMLMDKFGLALTSGDKAADLRSPAIGMTIKSSAWNHHVKLLRTGLPAKWYRGKIKALSDNAAKNVFIGATPEAFKKQYFPGLDDYRDNPHTKDNIFFFQRMARSMSTEAGGRLPIPANGPDEREKTVDLWFPEIDWDELKRMLVPWLERMAEAEKLPTNTERRAAYQNLKSDVEAFAEKYTSPENSTSTELAAAVIFPPLISAQTARDNAFTRTETFEKMLPIQYAIAAYHAEHKAWPDSLDDELPELPELPTDPFSGGRPFGYRKFDGGCVVYSVGENGTPDGNGETFLLRLGLPDDVGDLFWNHRVDDIGFFQLDDGFSPGEESLY